MLFWRWTLYNILSIQNIFFIYLKWWDEEGPRVHNLIFQLVHRVTDHYYKTGQFIAETFVSGL